MQGWFEAPIRRRTSLRTAGNSSVSNQGLAASHALLRQEGWGRATRRGLARAAIRTYGDATARQAE